MVVLLCFLLCSTLLLFCLLLYRIQESTHKLHCTVCVETKQKTESEQQELRTKVDKRRKDSDYIFLFDWKRCNIEQILESVLSENKQVAKQDSSSTPRDTLLDPGGKENKDSHQTKNKNTSTNVGCEGEKGLVSWVTGKVRARGAAQCRRKTRIVKIFSRPAKEPRRVMVPSSLELLMEQTISRFDQDNLHLDNKQYAAQLWEELENGNWGGGTWVARAGLRFHVTVSYKRNNDEHHVTAPHHPWVWTRYTANREGSGRVVTVLAGRGEPDLDQLDCLQQAALSVRVGCVQCVQGAEQKGAEVVRRCGGEKALAGVSGVAVICWGCGVWHRWSRGFPVLHVQGADIWNTVVWAHNPPQN